MKYKISIDTVVDIFTSVAGDNESTNGRVFCRSAIGMMEQMLDDKKDLSGNSYQICYATACVAYYRYILHKNTGALDVKAGDIMINDCSDNVSEHAKNLMSDALNSISHLMKPKRFAFIKTGE